MTATASKPAGGVADGVRWTYFAAMLSGGLQIALLAIMARLIEPAAFGILTTGLLVLKACQVLVQSGYERAVVWTEELTDKAAAGLFWVSILTGAAICLVVLMLSWPISGFFSEPQLQMALAVLSPMALLSAPGLVSRGILRRQMRFRDLALYEVACYFIGFVCVGLPLALNGFGLWALVIANLVQCLLQGVLPLVIARHVIFKSFSGEDIAAPLRFGYSVSGLGIIEFVDSQATAVFIGRSFGMGSLGVFNRAYALIQLPVEQLGTSLTRVLFSPFNRARGNPEQLRLAAQTPLRLLAALVLPLALGGGAAAPTVVAAMLGEGWELAAPIFSALCVGTAAAVLGNLLATMNEALALIRQKTIAQIAVTSLLIVLLFVFGSGDLVRAAMCFSFTRVLFLLAQVWIAAPHLGLGRLKLAATMGPGLVIGITVAALVLAIEQVPLLAALPVWPKLVTTLAVAGLGTGIGALILLPELRLFARLPRRRLQRNEV